MSYIYIYKLWLRISEGFLVEGQKREERYMTARVILCVGVSLRRHVIEQLQKNDGCHMFGVFQASHLTCIWLPGKNVNIIVNTPKKDRIVKSY